LKFTFSREERLKSKETLASLFSKGSHFVFPPLHVRYRYIPSNKSSVQVAFTVPKKKFKRAVDRNLLKRRMREAYRLNKSLIEEKNQSKLKELSIIFIYSSQEILSTEKIESAMLNFMNQQNI
tara:strand:- start:435 stop:803 length:369 start_codon:yes stop_codon:yes gene_type:complete